MSTHTFYIRMGELEATNFFYGGHYEHTIIPLAHEELEETARSYGSSSPYFLVNDALSSQMFGFIRKYIELWNETLGMEEVRIGRMAESLANLHMLIDPNCLSDPLDRTISTGLKYLLVYRTYIPDFEDVNEVFITSFARHIASFELPKPPVRAGQTVRGFLKAGRRVIRKPASIQ
jgi:hypothetical protein